MADSGHGWNRPSAARGKGGRSGTPRAAKPALWRGILAGAVVAAAGCALLWYALPGGRGAAPEKAQSGKPPAAAPEARPKAPAPRSGGDAKKELKVPKLSGKRIERRDEIPAPQTLEELQAAVTNRPPRKVAFTNGVEQLIALATPSEPGGRVPPLPLITDADVAREMKAAMGHVIRAEEDDSESVLEKKITVARAKEEFRELRETEGCTFSEYLNALRDQANLDADFLADAHRMSDELYHDEGISDEDYLKYRDQINEKLAERGLPLIE